MQRGSGWRQLLSFCYKETKAAGAHGIGVRSRFFGMDGDRLVMAGYPGEESSGDRTGGTEMAADKRGKSMSIMPLEHSLRLSYPLNLFRIRMREDMLPAARTFLAVSLPGRRQRLLRKTPRMQSGRGWRRHWRGKSGSQGRLSRRMERSLRKLSNELHLPVRCGWRGWKTLMKEIVTDSIAGSGSQSYKGTGRAAG